MGGWKRATYSSCRKTNPEPVPDANVNREPMFGDHRTLVTCCSGGDSAASTESFAIPFRSLSGSVLSFFFEVFLIDAIDSVEMLTMASIGGWLGGGGGGGTGPAALAAAAGSSAGGAAGAAAAEEYLWCSTCARCR